MAMYILCEHYEEEPKAFKVLSVGSDKEAMIAKAWELEVLDHEHNVEVAKSWGEGGMRITYVHPNDRGLERYMVKEVKEFPDVGEIE